MPKVIIEIDPATHREMYTAKIDGGASIKREVEYRVNQYPIMKEKIATLEKQLADKIHAENMK